MLATCTTNLEQTEVALPIAVQSVMLLHDIKRGVIVDSIAKLFYESIVSNRSPTIRSLWSLDGLDSQKIRTALDSHTLSGEEVVV